ncbi:Sec63-domain-containing protein [Phlegmacium glaucopus]|nr:Sec63-domain-containing protein [Phlegmacium glaucopus]
MPEILKHIGDLVSSSETTASKDTANEWIQFCTIVGDNQVHCNDLNDSGIDWDEFWSDSVLNVYRFDLSSLSFGSAVMTALYSKPLIFPSLQPLLTIISSPQTNDEISAQLAELLGFNEIALIVDILDNRSLVREELELYLNKSQDVITSGLESSNNQRGLDKQALSNQNARKRMQEQFKSNSARPMFSGIAEAAQEVYPHVYSSSGLSQGNVVSQFGTKYMLPIGTDRQVHEEYEEVIIPAAKPIPPRAEERLILISELEELVKGCFTGYRSLNRIQSIIYQTAYGSNENLLICAPTGAGKTDVAMLAILRVIDQHRSSTPASSTVHIRQTINLDTFKVIYVAPMKALASEIVRKLGKRLAWLSIKVRELTGDMQLTRAEIASTQIIVTTPEKWDVVTRKPTGEGELVSSLKLLIIDEVHLLNEERGAVIETIVARTLRQVESSQSMIRIVGLSATLPNYKDVAEFLSVSLYKGLFYFDSSFRPVPLEQHFLGIKGKAGSLQSRKNLDQVTFQKVSELVAKGHQVMVFVHARKETVKAAMNLREMSAVEGNAEDFSCEEHPQWNTFRQKIGESRNKEMRILFDSGFGIHHAGMLRSDRNMIEGMFEAKAIKVLCCTATLAWGVNLPAHAVIIKGTQVYDSMKGNFVDLSVLDVLQVFGRAGRPGFETSGEGYICTTEDKLTHYLDAVTSQVSISQFQTGMIDALNAEISLGTVSNVHDAVQWLGYTYLFVRMRVNPFVYGIARDSVVDDPQLGGKRKELVNLAAQKLAETKMITFENQHGRFNITDLGRIAAKYYIRHSSMEIFTQEFRPKMSEADVLGMLCKSTEARSFHHFDQIQIRESEVQELEHIMKRVPCEVKGGTDTTAGKVNILLQGYISREIVEDFALVSDMAYVAQNGGRIIRAVLEIAMSKKWSSVTAVLLELSKAVETRLWPFHHPLKQFQLKAETLYNLETWADEWSVTQLAGFDAASLGKLVHLNEQHGRAIVNAAKQFPSVQILYGLQPIAADILKVCLKVNRAFEWSTAVHGTSEHFWIWVEDDTGLNVLQSSRITFRETTDTLKIDFFISIPQGQPPPFVTIRSVSDRWVGAEDNLNIAMDSLIMPPASPPHTRLLNLPFLSMNELEGFSNLARIFSRRLHTFNNLQTQYFWNLVRGRRHSLVCAPSGSGKSTAVQMLVWYVLTILEAPSSWIWIVTPTKAVALEMISELRPGSQLIGARLEYEGAGSLLAPPTSRTIRIITAATLLEAFSKPALPTNIQGLRLVVCENLEQLDSVYELGISLLKIVTQSASTRFVGLSASVNDPTDLANWLDVEPAALSSFRPQDRDQSLTMSSQTFAIPHSVSLFKAMAGPAHRAIQYSPPGSPALIFVPSRGQCRSTAMDLVTHCTLDLETARGYIDVNTSDELIGAYCARLNDKTLVDFVSKGVGFFHPGIVKSDRNLMLEMYAEGFIRVLIVPRDSCWIVPVRAAIVIVMGTQFAQTQEGSDIRQMLDYSLTELVRMQSRAVRHTGAGQFHLFCQAEALETYSRFLDDGLPVESQLTETKTLQRWVKTVFHHHIDKQQVVDALSFTFLAQRVISNPSYYGFTTRNQDEDLSAIVDQLVEAMGEPTEASS